MTTVFRHSLLLVGLALVAAFAGAQEPGSERGAALLVPFKQELSTALQEGLAQGPVAAIAACRLRAPEISAALSTDSVRMGRSSHRLRNPANAAPSWVAPILDAYVAGDAEWSPGSVVLPDGRSGYVEPIGIKPLCLTCHGDSLAPDIAARIDELYPDDRAVGFQVGDLRGVFWVEFPAEE